MKAFFWSFVLALGLQSACLTAQAQTHVPYPAPAGAPRGAETYAGLTFEEVQRLYPEVIITRWVRKPVGAHPKGSNQVMAVKEVDVERLLLRLAEENRAQDAHAASAEH